LLLVWLALKGLFFRDLLSIDLIAFPVVLVGFYMFLFLSWLCAKAGCAAGWLPRCQACFLWRLILASVAYALVAGLGVVGAQFLLGFWSQQ
jgi:hypothetical protein